MIRLILNIKDNDAVRTVCIEKVPNVALTEYSDNKSIGVICLNAVSVSKDVKFILGYETGNCVMEIASDDKGFVEILKEYIINKPSMNLDLHMNFSMDDGNKVMDHIVITSDSAISRITKGSKNTVVLISCDDDNAPTLKFQL